VSNSKFKISLRENGEHSFKKSLESYSDYDKTKDQMLLKDTIMFLHNGIELLMKEMLVQHSEYLIYEELKDIHVKQKEARIKGIGIFYIDYPPKSVTYEVAIKRVDAFINPPELDDSLLQNLTRLNRLRNQLEHYAIDADKEEVVRILEAIHKPILNLFENHLGPLTQLQTPQINQTWQNINHSFEAFKQKNHEVCELVKKFNGQKVPGSLLGVDGEVILPKFNRVSENYLIHLQRDTGPMLLEIDILAESSSTDDGTRWIVETKLRRPRIETVYRVHSFGQLTNSVSWLVAFDKVSPSMRLEAKNLKVMITGLDEFEELKKLVVPTN